MALLLDLTPEGREVPPPAGRRSRRPVADRRCRCSALGLLGVPRYPLRMLRALPKAIPNLEDTPFGIFPGMGTRLAGGGHAAAATAYERPGPDRAQDDLQRARLAAPALRLRPARRSTSSRRPRTSTARRSTTSSSSVCAGAVRRWLIEHDDLPDTPLVAQVPVSVRTGEQFGTYGNRILLMAAPLYTDEPDPVRAAAQDPRGAGGA